MAQWGKNDQANNSPQWGPNLVNKEANTANRDALFGNTTADAFVTNQTVGVFGVNADEARAARAAGDGDKVASPGWQLRTVGSGGRAGRVQVETLVAFSSGTMTGDAEDGVYEDFVITLTTQPVDASGNSAADEQVTFTVVAETVPSGKSVTYLWEYTTSAGNTETFATTAAVSGFSGQTTATLTADANTIADGTLVHCVVSGTGADAVTSDNATLTVS